MKMSDCVSNMLYPGIDIFKENIIKIVFLKRIFMLHLISINDKEYHNTVNPLKRNSKL